MQAINIAPGYYPDMTNAAYHAALGASKSKLDDARESLRNYWAKHVDPDRVPEERTEALLLGEAIHTATLEPDMLTSRFICVPVDAPNKPSSRTINAKKPSPDSVAAIQWWSGFQKEHADKQVLTRDQMDVVDRCQNALYNHPAWLLLTDGKAEESFFAIDPETGALIKAKTDWWRPSHRMIVDVKSCLHSGVKAFGRAADNERYHVQSWFHPHVVNCHYGDKVVDNFVFLAIEKEHPNPIGVYYATADDFADGEIEAREDLAAILEAERTGIWPDHALRPNGELLVRPLQRPRWNRRRYLD